MSTWGKYPLNIKSLELKKNKARELVDVLDIKPDVMFYKFDLTRSMLSKEILQLVHMLVN